MDLSKLFEQALGLGHAAFAKAADVVGAGVGYVRETVGSIELFGSTEASDTYGAQKFDEKHYFLVPCLVYLREDLERRRKKGQFTDLTDSRRFSDRLNLFAMIGGDDPADTEELRRIFEEEHLWSWDPAKLGQPPEIGVDRSDRLHLAAFLRIVGSGKTDWTVLSDKGALSYARQHLISNDVSA